MGAGQGAKGFDWRATPGLGVFAVLVMVFLYAPLVVLIVYAFNASNLAMTWGGFSLQWFAKAISNADLRRAAMNSVIVAVAATVVSTVVAVPAAIALERGRRFLGRGGAEALIALPLVAPEIVTAIATLVFFSAIGLRLGIANVAIAHIVFCIPFALLPIRARLRDTPRDIEDAARDLYAGEWQVFRRVTLPLLMPGIVSGAMLAFIVSLDDFLITLMVAEAGSTTLPVYLYGMLRLGVTPEANAAATLLLAASVAAVVAAFLVMRRGARVEK
ncbi:spermidine/putrescine transport system permease protein [Pseudoxanthobacter soli DSM 19599]|uniref:Spermidine/putrescine transport system permease protein PotC n=1 Tax=Pseudoxanthobacter soli DSM 19599 TaxID=1123029 RepID=A0A1M7ZRC6_9HYPH|nr:ABC transporter permease [Pseudoxanthobacter soli]SHO67382.1 spermidine/putrescine transport system permease protein [Pseudoxanthobacter soli DSM 19599]